MENHQVKQYKNLFEFLQDHKYDKNKHNDGPTHTRIGDSKKNIAGGSYYIDDNQYELFMNLYYNDVFTKKKKEHLTERQLNSEYSPIAVDLDLHFDINIENRVYSQDHLDDLVDLYLEELKEIYQFDENTQFPIFLFEKDNMNRVEEKKITKDGIHIIFGINMEHKGQCILRKKILSRISEAWGDFPIVNTWNDVLDEGVSIGYTNWQLYGSCKPHHENYKLKTVYKISYDGDDNEIITIKEDSSKYLTKENFKLLSVRNKNHVSCFYKNSFMSLLECEKSEIPIQRTTSNLSDKNNDSKTFDVFGSGSGSDEISKIKTSEELDNYLQRFLDSIPSREYKLRELYDYTTVLPEQYYGAGSYAKWIRVGWALKNTSNRLLIVWIVFSAKSSNFTYDSIPELCEQWDTFDIKKDSGVTKRSIIYWATQHCPEFSESIRKSTIGHYLDMTINNLTANAIANPSSSAKGCGDYDIAVVLHQMFKDEYVCSDVKNGSWWRFRNHRWREIDCGTTLRKAISNDLRELYELRVVELQNYLASLDPEDDKYKLYKMRVDTVIKIIQRLGQTSDKKNIMLESRDLFYDDEFYDRLDSNPYLLGCKNGVIDFKNKMFRKGLPEDYITKCTDISYYPLTSSKHKDVIPKLHDFMSKIFVNEELREYMWNHLAGLLVGMPSLNQSLYNYIGFGQNGKSVLTDFMAQVLGSYKATAPISIITQGRGKVGGLAPEIVGLKGARYVVMQEPESNDIVHEGPMKELVSGIEPITARAPYMTKPTTFVPQFALVVCCNQLLGVRTQDHGTWRRLKVIPFDSLFTEKPVTDDPEKPNQFKIDVNLTDNFPLWRETMLSMLVERAYKHQGRIPNCDIVLSASNNYKQQQDHLSEYIEDRILRCEGYTIRKSDLSNDFKQWYNTNIGGKHSSPKKLHEYMDKRFGKNRGGVWNGVKLKLVEESDFQVTMEEMNNATEVEYNLNA